MKKQGIKEDSIQLLRNASGAFRLGILTAIVVINGVGKTTLMDVLAGIQYRGCIKGSINISGYPNKYES